MGVHIRRTLIRAKCWQRDRMGLRMLARARYAAAGA